MLKSSARLAVSINNMKFENYCYIFIAFVCVAFCVAALAHMISVYQ